MSTIKNKPMLFSGEMVRALLDGRKTQTRRIVKPCRSAEGIIADPMVPQSLASEHLESLELQDFECIPDGDKFLVLPPCPYGTPGDLLWVRETTHRRPMLNILTGEHLDEKFGGAYSADGADVLNADGFDFVWWHSRPVCSSIYMPRWASRLTLEITGVRVERLKSISYDDAISEGVAVFNEDDANLYYSGVSFDPESWFDEPYKWHLDGPREAFFELWDSINFDRGAGVATNPWVWVIEFKTHHCNVDTLIKQREGQPS